MKIIPVRPLVAHARRNDWTVVQLKVHLKDIPDETLQKLINGSAIVSKDTNETEDGTFVIYVP